MPIHELTKCVTEIPNCCSDLIKDQSSVKSHQCFVAPPCRCGCASELAASAPLRETTGREAIEFQTGCPTLTLNGSTLCGMMDSLYRTVSGVVPCWRLRHDPKADFSGRAGTTPKTTRWAATQPGPIRGQCPLRRRSPRCSWRCPLRRPAWGIRSAVPRRRSAEATPLECRGKASTLWPEVRQTLEEEQEGGWRRKPEEEQAGREGG
jgi:hypothetical protein